MTLRDDLIPCVDECRELIDDLGLRRFTVETRVRTWHDGEPGAGESSDVITAITPKPVVKPPSPRTIAGSAGFYEIGDRVATKVSATYTRAQLTGEPLKSNQAFAWLIDGQPFQVMSAEPGNFGWTVHLRQLNRKR